MKRKKGAVEFSVKEIKKHFFLFIGIFILVVTGFLFHIYDIKLFQDTQVVRIWIASFGFWAPFVYILLMIISIIFIPLPNFIIGLAASFLFPWYLASFYTLLADFLGSSITFFLARMFGRPFVKQIIKKEYLQNLDKFSRHLGSKTIFIVRLIPGFNFDLVGYLAGITRISYISYIATTMLGILPRRIGTYYLIEKSIIIDPLLVFIGVILSMIVVPMVLLAFIKNKRYRDIVEL